MAFAGGMGDPGMLPGAGGIGGLGGLFPGLGAGLSKSLNIDVGGNVGGGLGGVPYGPFGGVPYVPVTPLGSLYGFKGDLIVPIVVIGVAIFLLVVVILAIKAALAWKISLLAGMKKGKDGLFRRAVNETIHPMGAAPVEENQLNELAHMVLTAIQSQTCAQKVVCQIGTYARDRDGLSGLLRILESMVPANMTEPLIILRSSAEGKFDCGEKYKCGDADTSQTPHPNKV